MYENGNIIASTEDIEVKISSTEDIEVKKSYVIKKHVNMI